MLTIEDLRNPKRKSGFDHVHSDAGSIVRPYRAVDARGHGHKKGSGWRGPRRGVPEEAAQDYCDYVNGQSPSNAPASLYYPGHAPRDSKERTAEEEEALRVLRDVKAQRENRQGYVYCIAEEGDNPFAVKVGYSVKPEARVGELQSGNPRVLKLLGTIPGTYEDENRLHKKYITHNLVGEWFKTTPELLREFSVTVKEPVAA